jgi:hypothetical protein
VYTLKSAPSRFSLAMDSALDVDGCFKFWYAVGVVRFGGDCFDLCAAEVEDFDEVIYWAWVAAWGGAFGFW